jgi:anti-anti-sigma factor
MKGRHIDTEQHDDVVVATLVGDIDLLNHEAVGEELYEVALAAGPLLVIDFAAVDYVDSNGVRMLFGLAREFDHSRIGWTIALGESSPLHRLFKVTTFDEVARIFPSVDEAIAAVRGPS